MIIREGSLGDTILTLPVFQTLRKNGFKIEFLGRREFLGLLLKLSCIDGGIPSDSYLLSPIFSKNFDIPQKIIDYFKKFDLIISYTHPSEILTENIKKIASCKLIVHPPFYKNLKIHISDYLLSPFENLFSNIERTPQVKIRKQKGKYLVIHPGSGSKIKNWPVENFLSVYEYFQKNAFILLGPAESEQVPFWESKAGKEKLIINPEWDKLIEIMENTDIYIGNDSGITHLFASAGIKTVAIYGPTDPKIWGPRGENVKILWKKVKCSGCDEEMKKKCKEKICLKEIKVEEVIEAVLSF